MTTKAGLSAAVLAGGMSRRMGRDKALLRLRPGDPPLAAMVIEQVARVADEVFLVASDRPEYAAFGVPMVPDRFPGTGTLGGIATAIGRAGHDHCLVVACDMPLLNHVLLAWMAGQPRDYDVLVPRLPGRSRQGSDLVYQTLHSIYGRGCLGAIERKLASGQLQVIGFFPEVRVREIDLTTVERFDPRLRSFVNANSPEAAAAAAKLLDAEGR